MVILVSDGNRILLGSLLSGYYSCRFAHYPMLFLQPLENPMGAAVKVEFGGHDEAACYGSH